MQSAGAPREDRGQKGAAGGPQGRPGAQSARPSGRQQHSSQSWDKEPTTYTDPRRTANTPRNPRGETGGIAPPDVEVHGKGAGRGAPGAARSSRARAQAGAQQGTCAHGRGSAAERARPEAGLQEAVPRGRQVRANSEAWPGLDPTPQRQATWVQVRRGKKKQTGHISLKRLRGRGPAEDLDRRAGGKVRPRPEDTRAQQRRTASEVGRGLARAPPGRRTGAAGPGEATATDPQGPASHSSEWPPARQRPVPG